MKQYELNGYTIAFPEIPASATEINLVITSHVDIVLSRKPPYLAYTGKFHLVLPLGNWKLFALSEVSEELAGEIVDEDDYGWFKTYTEKNDFWESTAHASLTSFVRAKVVEDNPWILIKKND